MSFICFDSKAQISVHNGIVTTIFDSKELKNKIERDKGVSYYLNNFINQFKVEKNEFEYPSNGLFGYISYDSIKYSDNISISNPKEINIPEILYNAFDEIGLDYVKSYTNFAFFKTGVHIDEFSKYFKEKGILVGRPFPPYYDWCRISTGKVEDVSKFADTLKKYYS